MTQISSRGLLRAVPPALLIWCALAAPAVAAEGAIATRFEMFGFAGAHVLSLHSSTDASPDHYGITVDFQTMGMAAVFVDMKSHAKVNGHIVGGQPQPVEFDDDSRRNGAERRARIDYRPGGDVAPTISPPLPNPVPTAELRGTVDNLSAYLRLQRQLALTGRCALTVRVFDGRHAYDLAFSDLGQQDLTPTGGQNYSGKAIACRMVRRNWPNFPDPEKDEGARQGTIWYARLVPGELLVPVRMRMDTQLGVIEGMLAELHGRGVNLMLME